VSWGTAQGKLATLEQLPWKRVENVSEMAAYSFQASGTPVVLNVTEESPADDPGVPRETVEGEIQRIRWVQVRAVTRGARTEPLTYTQLLVRKERAWNALPDENPEMKLNTLVIAVGQEETPVCSTTGNTGALANGGVYSGKPAVSSGREIVDRLVPLDLFVDSSNAPYDPNMFALGVSNYVPNEELPENSQFGDTCLDPKNLRLQAIHPVASTLSVPMKLEILRGGSIARTLNYTLDKKQDDRFRGRFLRLVSDAADDLAPEINGNQDPNNQTIEVQLGDTLRASYVLPGGTTLSQEIQVGRPINEHYSGSGHKRQDIREVKVNICVMRNSSNTGPVVTRPVVEEHVKRANERYAQAGIRLKVLGIIDMGGTGDPGKPLPTSETANFQDGFDGTYPDFPFLTSDEKALFALHDGDANSLDVYYVEFGAGWKALHRAWSYPARDMKIGRPESKNVIVMDDVTENYKLTLAHEIMHILLNDGHRDFETQTSLFYSPTSALPSPVDGTKRIGPNKQTMESLDKVGNDDTSIIRKNAETLP
jgi:hypothetical protein